MWFQCGLLSISWVVCDLPVEDKDQIRSGVVKNIHILHLHYITFLWNYEEICAYFSGTWSAAGAEMLCVLQRPSLCQTHGGLMGWRRWPNTHFHFTWETFHRLTGCHHNSGGIWQQTYASCGSLRFKVSLLSTSKPLHFMSRALKTDIIKYDRTKRHPCKIKAVVKMTSLPGDHSVDWKESNSSWMFFLVNIYSVKHHGDQRELHAQPLPHLSFVLSHFISFIFYVHRNRKKKKTSP